MSLKEAVERFLFDEAELLDRWRLAEWEALLTEDARYLVPPIGVVDGEQLTPETTLFVVADGREMIAARIERLLGKAAFAESPRSTLRRLIGNVRVLAEEEDEIRVSSNFTLYRIRRAEITTYVGQYRHRLLRSGDGFRIAEKKVLLDIDVLRGQGGLSVIL